MLTRRPPLIAEVPPLETEGLVLRGGMYEGDPTLDGYGTKKTVVFRGKRRVARSQPTNETRFSYIEFDNHTALFLGMLVKSSMKGQNLGRNLLEYFFGHVQEQGLSFAGTGKINKPLIALALAREGLRPKSQDHMAEILPPTSSPTDGAPLVRFLRGGPEEHDVVHSTPEGTPFYRVARASNYRGLDVNLNRTVAVHTGYNPPDSNHPVPPIPVPQPAI